MPGFPRRPLAVFVCCLFAGMQASHAADDIRQQGVADAEPAADRSAEVPPVAGDEPVTLRKERRFNVLGGRQANAPGPRANVGGVKPQNKDDEHPLFLIADKMDGQADRLTIAEGDVELRKAGALLFADRVAYRVIEDEVEASGNVRLMQDGATVETPYLRMRLADQIGHADKVQYHIVRQVDSKFYRPGRTVVTVASSNGVTNGAPMMLNVPDGYGLPTTSPPRRPSSASGQAERVDFEGENQFRFSTATYSTCKPGRDEWRLQAEEMHLDYDRQVADVRHASLWFQEAPILYLPAGSFSLNRQRKSGILQPSVSTSSNNGFDVTVPYYWNIAPDYDATLYPRYMAKRGFQFGGEARYLGSSFNGVTRAEYLPKDEQTEERRYAYHIQHQHSLGRGFSAAVNWQGVSDDTYWEDLSSGLIRTSQTQLPRHLTLGYTPYSWLQVSTQVLRYQTLQPDPENPIIQPYFLEPRVNVTAYKANVLNTDLSMIGEYSRFTHPDTVKYPNGDRLVLYPQVSLPIVHPAFQITPKFGVHMTRYQMDKSLADGSQSLTRTLPIFTLDSTVTFEREMSWLDKNYVQTLEPRLYYVNIPYREQKDIPLFDTALSDFNFAQMFSENRYSGFDRINDANQLTAALTTRLLDASTGAERFKAMIGQRYYFEPQRVAINGESTRQDNFSNLVAAVSGAVLPKTYVDAAWEYNYDAGANERFSVGARFQPELGKVLSASYRFTRDPLNEQKPIIDQFDIAGQWPIAQRWYAVGRFNYSLRDSQLLEAIGGIEYNDDCWSVRVVAQRLAALSGSPNTTLFLQLELNDFGSIGSTPLGLLRRSIPGYGKTNELPDSGSLLSTQ
ncbi:MAG: LPS-assembly protein LptD [Betaproteobacteria bacterium HGW-Betaproteobacteria-7]|jgi:LPS-assembly protein|nr:MAG: LPS-assembly protein LptD [Betaproteobacteria bacterium HGW-Betaproteobacteria-7]